MMELAYNRQRQQMVDTDARNQEQRRIVESDRNFQYTQEQAGINNRQQDQQLDLQRRQQKFSENKYDQLKKDADNKAAEVRRLTAAMGLPPVSDLDSIGVVTSLMAKKDAVDQKKSELKDTTALRSGILTASTLKTPAERLKAIQDAFANNPNAKVDTETMKQAATLLNRDRLMVNQSVFEKVATAGNISDLRAVQSTPGFAEWYADEANRAVWKDRSSELEKAEPKSNTRDVIKINNDGTVFWNTGVPAVSVEEVSVVDANGKTATRPIRRYYDKFGKVITVQQYNELLAKERGRMVADDTEEAAPIDDGSSLYPSTTPTASGEKSAGKAAKALAPAGELVTAFYNSLP